MARWTEEETQYLIDNYNKLSIEELCANVKRGKSSLYVKAFEMGLTRRPDCQLVYKHTDDYYKRRKGKCTTPSPAYSSTKLYACWSNIKGRCSNPNHKSWKYYGGKGVKICDEWRDSFVTFKEWADANGYDESLTIDRIDCDGDYCPDNCRFVDRTINNRNSSNAKLNMSIARIIRYLYYVENFTQSEINEYFNVSQSTICSVINNDTWNETD